MLIDGIASAVLTGFVLIGFYRLKDSVDFRIKGLLMGLLLLGSFNAGVGEELYNESCIRILHILSGDKKKLGHLDRTKVNIYMQYQKDLTGESLYTAPIHTGVRINYDLLDKRERLERRQKYLRNMQYASNLLGKFLSLKAQVEEEEKLLKWQWARVEEGIEYKRDIWEMQIKHNQKKAQLKAMYNYFMAIGISKKLLDKCYYQP
jgi:hypothetical protein